MGFDCEVGIVGAGFGGIIAALELQRSGRESFILFERAREVGGVWRDNIYPGCACDVRSHLYSIASEPNPGWSSSFASQAEILQYLKDVVSRRGLASRIRYGANIREVRFLEEEGGWLVTTAAGETFRVRVLLLATGPQSRPWMPAFAGQETFDGALFHSSAWDSSVELEGKRVAVVGTGASAIQIVPSLAPAVKALFVFQRTPAWVLPRHDRRLSRFERWLFAAVPATQTFARNAIYWAMELFGLAFLGNRLLSRCLTAVALRKIRHEVRDESTRARLTPQYELGCKRVLVSDDFYPSFNRPNVKLVTDGIAALEPGAIRTEGGLRVEVDHIVLATGFVVADTDNYLRVIGRDGRVLTDDWNSTGAEAYLGIHVAGYPNLAILLGPNSGLGHSSALHVIESQIAYILQFLDELDRRDAGESLDVNPDVQSAYNGKLQARFAGTVWASGCRSWYMNRKGKNSTLYPGLTMEYRRRTARLAVEDYVAVRSLPRESKLSAGQASPPRRA